MLRSKFNKEARKMLGLQLVNLGAGMKGHTSEYHNEIIYEYESEPRVLIIGIGNQYRRDDAVGLIVARALREKNLAGVEVLEMSGEGAALIEAFQNAEHVIVIDAVCSGATPGTIVRFEAHRQRIPTEFFRYSTHNFGLAEAIELARSLGKLPKELIVYGIEGRDFTVGEGLSPEVARAAQEVTQRIGQELRGRSYLQ